MATIAQPRTGTFSALRHTNFRLYFAGQFVAISGMWMQMIAQGWLVYDITGSELWLGIVAASAGLPSLVLSPFGGVVADRWPRRYLLMITSVIQMALALILAALVLLGTVQVWHVVVLAALGGITKSVDAPARQAFVKDMVGGDDLASGITLNSLMVNMARIVGPTLAGGMLATVGSGWCFLLAGLSYVAVLFSLRLMRVAHTRRDNTVSPLAQLREGLVYSHRHPIIAPLLLLAAMTAALLVNTITLLPSFASNILHSPISGYSTLTTAQGVGAIVAGMLMATLTTRLGHGRVLGLMQAALVVSTLTLARTTTLPAAALMMGVYGFALVLIFVNTNTLLQTQVPDDFRGRVLSLFTLTFVGVAPVGALLMGGVADLVGTPTTITLYACLNGAAALAIFARWPQVWSVP